MAIANSDACVVIMSAVFAAPSAVHVDTTNQRKFMRGAARPCKPYVDTVLAALVVLFAGDMLPQIHKHRS